MPNDTKWQSPHGHAIASSETDKKPPCPLCGTEEQLNCFMSGEEYCGQPDLLAEAVKVIVKCEAALSGDWQDQRDFVAKYRDAIDCARDFLAKIER